MLSFPDQQRKFEQLRAHWEAAETGDTNMGGRRGKLPPHHAANDDIQHNAGSKFRRTLSHGLAFISLTQRKGVPGRQLLNNASLTVSAPSTNDSSVAILGHETLLSPQTDSVSLTSFSGPLPAPQGKTRARQDVRTPTQLPRSRTLSYIPRPVKTDTQSGSVAELEQLAEPLLDITMTDPNTQSRSRIPTPSPPQAKRPGSSPRQYLPQNRPLQAKSTTNRQSFTSIVNSSPSKAAIRSRTTPNLLKTNSTSQTAGGMAQRRPGLKEPLASSTTLKPMLSENLPKNKRASQRLSQIQDKAVKRESLLVPSATPNRSSIGLGTSFAHSKRSSFAAPSASAKRVNPHLAHTAVNTRPDPSSGQKAAFEPDSPSFSVDATPIAHPRLMGPKSPPTPTPSTIDIEGSLLAPPRLGADNDTQRRTLGTPNGLGGIWRSSKVFAAANHQVRRLPRSSTFHHFGGRWEAPPPVPPVPNQYKLPSSSDLVQSVPKQHKSPSLSNLHYRFPTCSGMFGTSNQSVLSEIAAAQKSTEIDSLNSMSSFVSVTASESADDAEKERSTSAKQEIPPDRDEDAEFKKRPSDDPFLFTKPSMTTSKYKALPPITAKIRFKPRKMSASGARPKIATGDLPAQRCWSISERFFPDSANDFPRVQVKDYMPPLYWAGRFQSRFDQWRTEAMVASLKPNNKSEDDGPLGQCSLNSEKQATILIFMQLRDLCASSQAADSLQVRLSSPYEITVERVDTR